MLSYVNGGYVKSIYAIAKKFANVETDRIIIEDVASLAEAPLIVPQEELGQGCIRYFGMKDLLDFVKCFPSFQQMLQTPHWREKWIVLLERYFQAIPRPSGRRRNFLSPVVANALGTLLENLARSVLVDDDPSPAQRKKAFDDRKLASNQGYNGLGEYRIDTLLQRIGISSDKNFVTKFIRIRNNATHAEPKPTNLTEIEEWEVMQKAIQWVDEVVLWRLGYEGQYRERSLYSIQGIQPRYDLSRRDSSW